MKQAACKTEVTIYLRGANLDPVFASTALGLKATKSQTSGEKRRTSTNKEFVTRVGLWALAIEADSNSLPALIDELVLKVKDRGTAFAQVVGVEDAYLDVFMAVDADSDGGGTCEFGLSQESFRALLGFGLPVRFTVAVVRP
jgi:hypothetical protein